MKKFLLGATTGILVGSVGTLYLEVRAVYRSDMLRPYAKDFVNDVIHTSVEKAIYGDKPKQQVRKTPTQLYRAK